MPPWTSARLPLPVPVLLLLFSGGVRCAVEVHTAAGQHRDGLLALSPLQTIAAGPTMARRAHCLARCSRLAECVSFNYGLLPSGITGCQLLSATLCQSGGGFSELQRDAGVRYFDVYRAATGSSEVSPSGDRCCWDTTRSPPLADPEERGNAQRGQNRASWAVS